MLNDLNPKTYHRRPFSIQAVQVNEHNINKIAEWCGGTVAKTLDDNPKLYIHLAVRHQSGRKFAKAFYGDWVVNMLVTFKVYNNRAFEATFTDRDPRSH